MKSLAGLGSLLTSPHLQWERANLPWSGSHAATPGPLSGCLCTSVCPSLHLVSLHLAFVCASGYHTGHSGRFPPTGVPRWVQVPEGVIYATITLGTACPRAGMPWIPCLAAWLSEMGCMPRAWPLPSPHPCPCALHAMCSPSRRDLMLLSTDPACGI